MLALTILACVLALVVAVGCGQSDEARATNAVEKFVDGRNSGDYEQVCELFTDEFKRELGYSDENCARKLREMIDEGPQGEAAIVDVRVRDDRGTADIDFTTSADEGSPSRVALVLEKKDGDWLVAGQQ